MENKPKTDAQMRAVYARAYDLTMQMHLVAKELAAKEEAENSAASDQTHLPQITGAASALRNQ